jgi:hypothetical protein
VGSVKFLESGVIENLRPSASSATSSVRYPRFLDNYEPDMFSLGCPSNNRKLLADGLSLVLSRRRFKVIDDQQRHRDLPRMQLKSL